MINAFILCDLFENFLKFMQQTEKEALIWLKEYIQSENCDTKTEI